MFPTFNWFIIIFGKFYVFIIRNIKIYFLIPDFQEISHDTKKINTTQPI